jgi:hypothetical protein
MSYFMIIFLTRIERYYIKRVVVEFSKSIQKGDDMEFQIKWATLINNKREFSKVCDYYIPTVNADILLNENI